MTDHSQILDLVQAQPQGMSLARPFYTDPGFYQADLDLIWYKTWIFAANLVELPKAGAYVTLQLGAYPVVVVKGTDGEVRQPVMQAVPDGAIERVGHGAMLAA